jgi:hypothetical protein
MARPVGSQSHLAGGDAPTQCIRSHPFHFGSQPFHPDDARLTLLFLIVGVSKNGGRKRTTRCMKKKGT